MSRNEVLKTGPELSSKELAYMGTVLGPFPIKQTQTTNKGTKIENTRSSKDTTGC